MNTKIQLRKNLSSAFRNAGRLLGACAGILLAVACEDFVEVGAPKTEITIESVFSTDASAQAAINGIYSRMMSNQSFTRGDLERYTGLSSDELTNYSTNAEQMQFANASLLPANTVVLRTFWGEAYAYISQANAILEGLTASTTVTESVRKQLEGQALFVRAYCHFYLVNLFGDIPYITSTDYRVNAGLPRTNIDQVYMQIVKDLTTAKSLMPTETSVNAATKNYPKRNAVCALLSRVYLYAGQWASAEIESTQLIDANLYQLEEPGAAFLASSRETIWHLKPVVPGINTPQGNMFIITSSPGSTVGRVALSPQLFNAFDAADARLQWIGTVASGANTYHFPRKYKVSVNTTVTEHAIMFRLAEVLLIRAEARAHLNKLTEAHDDLNLVRTRAGLPSLADNTTPQLLAHIANERKFELFAENGHRWLDLKRTGKATEVLAPLKANWDDHDTLYPIPQAEILLNPMLTQNTGY